MRKQTYWQANIRSDMKHCLKQIIKDENLITQILEKSKIIKIKKNKVLTPDKSKQDSLYILHTGMIHVYTSIDGVQTKNITDCLFYKMGELIRLDYSAADIHPKTQKTYQAIKDCILLQISTRDWNELYTKYNDLVYYYRLTITNEHAWHKQLRDMRFLNVSDRYNWLKTDYPELCDLERRHLLSLLDISLSSYKNLKKK